MKLIIVVLAFCAISKAEDSDNTLETAINFIKDCKGDYVLCVKEKLLDNVRASRSINIAEGAVFKGEPELRSPKKLKRSLDEGRYSGGGYSSYGSDWNKNPDEAQNLAYSGYSQHK